MGRILYIVYLWLFFVPVFLVLTILTAVTVIIGCLLGGEKIFAYYPGMIWSRLTCYLALCPVTVKGREHINRKQSYVFVANHQGAFDIFLIYGFLGVPIKCQYRPRPVLSQWQQLYLPFLSPILILYNYILYNIRKQPAKSGL